MVHELKPYPAYKDSGMPFIGDVPEHWEVRRMRNTVELLVSNVDKLAADNETPVRLCNYTDVYKNDRIASDMPFMQATATLEEIERFRLVPGDVLITKDSEDWSDIGVPAVVVSAADDLVCGYHLAILRPLENHLMGDFLFRLLQSQPVSYQLQIRANGVTRYGLSLNAIKSTVLPVAPLSEQRLIVQYLDYMDRRIQHYIRSRQKLIMLINEQRQAIIQSAVTRGLDPTVRFKSSGVEWLGDVPDHWEVVRLGALLRERGETNDDLRVADVLSVTRTRGVIPYAEKGNVGNKKSDDITRYKIVRPDDIVVNSMNVIIGSVGLSAYHGCLSPVYYVLCRRHEEDDPQYLNAYFQTKLFQRSLVRIGNGIMAHRMRIPMELLKCELFPRPPANEQAEIVQYANDATSHLTAAIDHAEREVKLLGEYRTRLITDVVTGKLDVREASAHIPSEAIKDDGMIEDVDPLLSEDLEFEELEQEGLLEEVEA